MAVRGERQPGASGRDARLRHATLRVGVFCSRLRPNARGSGEILGGVGLRNVVTARVQRKNGARSEAQLSSVLVQAEEVTGAVRLDSGGSCAKLRELSPRAGLEAYARREQDGWRDTEAGAMLMPVAVAAGAQQKRDGGRDAGVGGCVVVCVLMQGAVVGESCGQKAAEGGAG